jgi:hypothetical protein
LVEICPVWLNGRYPDGTRRNNRLVRILEVTLLWRQEGSWQKVMIMAEFFAAVLLRVMDFELLW